MKSAITDKIQAVLHGTPDSADHTQWLTAIHPALKLRISKRARRLALRLDHAQRTMYLVVPPRFSVRKAEHFARAHKDWIAQKIAELPAPVPFVDGAQIPVLGRQRRIAITYDITLKTTNITLDKNDIIVSTNKEDPAARITRFLKNEACDTLAGLAREKAAIIEKTISNVQVRDTKSRWGSCAPDGRISFSWRLIFAPWEAMDYVVAHEVAHLRHMNHSRHFWQLCAELSENYDAGKSWIRQNGHELVKYG